MHARIMREVIEPTMRGLAADGMPFTGFLYAGIMIAPDGTPNVLEFNCRFGDPETQPILMRLTSDLTVLCEAALAGELHRVHADWDPRAALGVVMAAAGYPDHGAQGRRSSKGSTWPRACRARSSTPARASRTARYSPTAAACCARWAWEPPWPARNAKPTH